MRSIKTAVITGPTGAIGVALSKLLIENGLEVYAVCRPDSGRRNNIPEGVNIISCDLSQLGTMTELIGVPVDAFFHFAWADTIGNGRNDMLSQTDNIKYTLEAVRTAKKLGCRVFIGAGSQAEYGRVDGVITPATPCFPENGYGMAKLCAGSMCRVECEKLGMDFIWTRILSVYGPYDGPKTMISSVIDSLLEGKRPALTSGEQMWDYIYSEDAARAFHLLALRGVSGKTYVIAGGKSMPLKEYVKILRDCIDGSAQLGFGEIPSVNPVSLIADISELTDDTGFLPLTDFNSGIVKTIEFIRSGKSVGDVKNG